MNRIKSLLIALFAITLSSNAQGCFLSKAENLLCDSDVLSVMPMPYFYTEKSSSNSTWDFSDLMTTGQNLNIWLQKDSLDRHLVLTSNDITYYDLSGDTLFIVHVENPLSKITYDHPILSIKYPFAYGDSISVPFSGYGVYCGDHPFREQGMSMVMADAAGSIVLGEDTIQNVLRVYTRMSYSVCMDIDSAALDSARLKQIIEERYDWYARGYRYPLFTTVTSTSYDDAAPIGTTRSAWGMPPDSQRFQADSCNEDIRRKDSIAIAEKAKANDDIIHYTVSQNGNQITVNYSLDGSADVSALVSDVMGVVYRQCRQNNDKSDGYSLCIDCNGLRRGKYILYVNVNGKVYNEKITVL